MGREVSPATAMPWKKGQLYAKTAKKRTSSSEFGPWAGGPETYVGTRDMSKKRGYRDTIARKPYSGPSVGSISQPIDQTPPRSYKAALAQNIANGERQSEIERIGKTMAPAEKKLRSAAQNILKSWSKSRRMKKAGPPPSRGRDININWGSGYYG